MRRFWIGVDVSKKTLDVALVYVTGQVHAQDKVANSAKALEKLWKQWVKAYGFDAEDCMVCLEATGHHSNLPVLTLLDMKVPTWVAHPTDILKSIGTTRGKDDKVDALRIANYARRFDDKARLVTENFSRTLRLKQMITERKNLVTRKGSLDAKLKDPARYYNEQDRINCSRRTKAEVALLKKHIKELDQVIKEVIKADPQLHEQYKLLLSIDGVGEVLSAHFLAVTEGFTRYNTPRELACHAGVAPFRYTSGTSIKGKTRVSKQARKGLKTIVHMAATSVIRLEGELKDYYERKIAQGKNKMTVLNAIRNKIIHRVCAVIARGTPYMGRKTMKAA
ncbi:MAG: IS110 family transposase [Bacteroidota bacterium]|nr:IS110 family transposase [Bacteroidota bacterium]